MLKIIKKILSIFMLAILFITNSSSIIKAAYEFTESYIVEIGEAPYHLKYYNESKGMYTYSICAIVGHYENGIFYPAYCLNRDLKGVGKVASYTVDVDSVITDNKVWRAVKNGYPYKSAGEMGLSSDFDAFAVTKFAVYCLTGQADINLYIADDGDEEGQAMLRALHNLVDIGLNGSETFKNELKVNKSGDFKEEGEYYSLTYNVTAGSSISKYKIKSVTGIQDGDIITDVNGNIKTEFSSGENFKIKILKSHLNSNKNIDVELEASLKSNPMFYGKTRISGTQNYLLTANSYQNVEAKTNTNISLNNAKIKIHKIDSENKEAIENTVFDLYNEKNELIDTKTTNSKGIAEFENLFQGTYTIKEKKANEKYELMPNAEEKINAEYNKTKEITIENAPKKGNLIINKVDKDNNKIALGNVEFELYDENKKLIGKYNTDNNGKIEIDGLRIGNYELKETNTNKWYNLAKNTNIEVKWNETTEKTIENELKKSQIKIIKVDKDNNEIKIKGAVFEVQDLDGNVLEKVTTNEEGVAITKNYPIRDYQKLKLHEIETDKWYNLNSELQEVTLEENKQKTVTIENEKKKGQIRVIKVDLDNNEVKLQGVKFNVLDENSKIVETLITNEDGTATTKLLPIDQNYTLQEIETKENYVLNKELKTVTLTENEITDITFENEKKKGQIRVIKIDAENNEVKLANVEFNVLNKDGKVVEKLVTNKDGIATTKRLPIDEQYILQETKTDERYVLSNETKTVKLEENQITDIKFENEKIKGTIKVKKIASEDCDLSNIKKGEPIEGVKFNVYDNNDNLIQEITTNKDGIATTKKLEKGIYKVKEKQTNKWYILDEKVYFLEIKENNQIVEQNIENKPGKPEEEIIKTGPELAKADDGIEYKINAKNSGNVPLENFTWEDIIPTEYIRLTKIKTGTFNQENTYNLYYKTNLSEDYILFMEDISTSQNEEIDFSKELKENEYITNIKLEFKKVEVGFQNEQDTSIFAIVNSNVKRDDKFENKVTLTSNYNDHKLTKDSSWETKIYKILPVTGM